MARLKKEDRAGLYITVIVHLTVIIILLLSQLNTALQNENSFILDFSKQDEIEKLEKELEKKESISRKLDELIGSSEGTPVRNIAVDRSALKDDRGTDADELYKEAERIQKELDQSFKRSGISEEELIPINNPQKETKEEEIKETYSGPSVVSWSLEGRKASKLPIPAYRCMGSGEVTVIIQVNNSGNVILAKIDDSISSNDTCLREFAVRAARAAKFSSSPNAPAKQTGNIVYSFIAQ